MPKLRGDATTHAAMEAVWMRAHVPFKWQGRLWCWRLGKVSHAICSFQFYFRCWLFGCQMPYKKYWEMTINRLILDAELWRKKRYLEMPWSIISFHLAISAGPTWRQCLWRCYQPSAMKNLQPLKILRLKAGKVFHGVFSNRKALLSASVGRYKIPPSRHFGSHWRQRIGMPEKP